MLRGGKKVRETLAALCSLLVPCVFFWGGQLVPNVKGGGISIGVGSPSQKLPEDWEVPSFSSYLVV